MRRLSFIVTLLALGAVASAGAVSATPGDQIARLRAVTARFHLLEEAVAAGYVPAGPCVTATPEEPPGAMGIHYINPALAGDLEIDADRPELLLYMPIGDGELRLVGVEYWRVDVDQDLATDGDRPSVLGVPFDGPMLGHDPTMPIHYDLHVWVWAHNPSGLFGQFNPALACPSG